MRITQLHLQHFRNYREQDLSFSDGVNVLLGENAQGKTNALEAILLLATGKSHRTSKDGDLIAWGEDQATVTAGVVFRNREHRLDLRLQKHGKRAHVNGIPVAKMTEFIGHFQVVLFSPEDLQLVKGGPAARRRFLDIEMGQTNKLYLHHLSQYNKALLQRNTLLRKPDVDWSFVDVFDSQLVEHGSELLVRRMRFLEQLKQYADQTYRSISNDRETLSMRYTSSTGWTDGDGQASVQQLQAQFLASLTAKRKSDAQYGHTSVGPHRDDVAFYLNGKPVQAFASQGQQRTIALAVRLAEIDFIYQEAGEYPVLLLDDVLSELDDLRQTNLVLSMSERVQTVITATTLKPIADKLSTPARLFHVRSGIIQQEG